MRILPFPYPVFMFLVCVSLDGSPSPLPDQSHHRKKLVLWSAAGVTAVAGGALGYRYLKKHAQRLYDGAAQQETWYHNALASLCTWINPAIARQKKRSKPLAAAASGGVTVDGILSQVLSDSSQCAEDLKSQVASMQPCDIGEARKRILEYIKKEGQQTDGFEKCRKALAVFPEVIKDIDSDLIVNHWLPFSKNTNDLVGVVLKHPHYRHLFFRWGSCGAPSHIVNQASKNLQGRLKPQASSSSPGKPQEVLTVSKITSWLYDSHTDIKLIDALLEINYSLKSQVKKQLKSNITESSRKLDYKKYEKALEIFPRLIVEFDQNVIIELIRFSQGTASVEAVLKHCRNPRDLIDSGLTGATDRRSAELLPILASTPGYFGGPREK